jgi:uncharacterized protein
MTEQSDREERAAISEQEVAEYLLQHPDFFVRHEQVLQELTIPHPDTGKAVSLIERQVGLIREQKYDLKQQLQQLTVAANANEQLLQRFQVLVLNLIDSESLDQAITYIRDALQADFHADAVELVLFDCPERDESVSRDDKSVRSFQRILESRRPACGHFNDEQKQLLFGDKADEIASAVVVPLCADERSDCIGLLGIGSIDSKRYHPDMGTVFVGHLGAVMNRIFSAHLDR